MEIPNATFIVMLTSAFQKLSLKIMPSFYGTLAHISEFKRDQEFLVNCCGFFLKIMASLVFTTFLVPPHLMAAFRTT